MLGLTRRGRPRGRRLYPKPKALAVSMRLPSFVRSKVTRSQKSPPGVARNGLLARAIEKQIEIFEHNRADQSPVAFRFADGCKDAVPSQELYEHALDGLAPGAAAVGVANVDGRAQRQTKTLNDNLRQLQPCRTGTVRTC